MRALLTLVISFCLLHIQVHISYNSLGFGFTKAHAANDDANGNNGNNGNTGSNGDSGDSGDNGSSVTPGSGVLPGASATPSPDDEENIYSVEDEQGNPSLESGMIVEAILLIIIVLAAKGLIISCQKIDTWIYAGTSLYYIAMEIMNYGKYKKGSEAEMKIYADKDKDEQLEALMSAHNETKEAADAAHKKAEFARNAAIGFGLAGVVLALQWAATAWMGAEIDLMCPKPTPISTTTSFIPGNDSFEVKNEQKQEMYLLSNPQLTCSQDDHYYELFEIDKKPSDHNQLYLRDIHLKQKLEELTAKFDGTKEEKSKLESAIKYLSVEDANADGGVLAGLGIGAVGLVVITLWAKSFGNMIQGWFVEPLGRIIAYAVFAAIALVVYGLVEDAAKKLDKRAEQYKSLADKLTQQLNGWQIAEGGGFSNINRGQGPEASIQDPEKIKKTDGCFTGAPGSLKQDPNCLCKAANNCKQMEMPKVSFNGMSTPGIVSEPMSLFKSSGNNLYSGNMAGAQTDAAQLGQYAGKMNRKFRDLQKDINSRRKADGKNAIPFGSQGRGMRAKLTKMMTDQINGLNADEKNALAAIGGSQGLTSEDIDKIAKAAPAPAPVAKAAPAASGKAKAKDEFAGFDFGSEEPSGTTEEVGVDPNAIAAGMNDQGTFEGDITNRPDEDIFKIITTRYMKSAYPNFFDEGGNPPATISE